MDLCEGPLIRLLATSFNDYLLDLHENFTRDVSWTRKFPLDFGSRPKSADRNQVVTTRVAESEGVRSDSDS